MYYKVIVLMVLCLIDELCSLILLDTCSFNFHCMGCSDIHLRFLELQSWRKNLELGDFRNSFRWLSFHCDFDPSLPQTYYSDWQDSVATRPLATLYFCFSHCGCSGCSHNCLDWWWCLGACVVRYLCLYDNHALSTKMEKVRLLF
jgi:hypothetical protein